MKISVVIPVYNKEKYMDDLFQCLLSQTFEEFECILIDDGSTDASGEICDKVACIDKRFEVIHIPNSGVSHARNVGIDGYKLRWHSDIIYQCNYLDDGLTKGSKVLEKNNPMGYAMMYCHMLKYPECSKKQKFYAACQVVALSIVGGHIEYGFQGQNKRLILCALIPGIFLAIRRRYQFRKVST